MATTLCSVCHKPCPPRPGSDVIVCSLACLDEWTIRLARPACTPQPPPAPLRSLDDVLLELATRDCPSNSGEVIARELARLSVQGEVGRG